MSNKLKLIFGKSTKIGGYAIRAITWSRWSHVGVIDGEYVIESVWPKGVIKTPIQEFIDRYKDVAYAEIVVAVSAKQSLKLARQQLGKPYDTLGLFGVALRTGWSTDSSWTCSELIAYIAGTYRQERLGRITPEDIWKNSRDISNE